jgi:hypothetical protein
MEATLAKNYEILQSEYDSYSGDVSELQETLRDSYLPQLSKELDLNPEDVTWAQGWVDDRRTCPSFGCFLASSQSRASQKPSSVS